LHDGQRKNAIEITRLKSRDEYTFLHSIAVSALMSTSHVRSTWTSKRYATSAWAVSSTILARLGSSSMSSTRAEAATPPGNLTMDATDNVIVAEVFYRHIPMFSKFVTIEPQLSMARSRRRVTRFAPSGKERERSASEDRLPQMTKWVDAFSPYRKGSLLFPSGQA
jgi:hypothetical protein